MSATLNHILNTYQLKVGRKQPIDIPNIGRDLMAQLFNELGFTKGAEVGVETGLYSEVLCKAIPNLELFSIDAWLAYGEYRDDIAQDKVDELYARAVKRLAPYNAKLIKGLSLDVVKTFEDESLDFVYIDANHTYEHVYADVTEWIKKVRRGGIIAGHDFIRKIVKPGGKSQNNGIIDALIDYTKANKISPWFVLGRKKVIPGEVRDGARSWMIVK